MSENKKTGILSKFTIFMAVLCAISSIVLALYIGFSTKIKSNIISNIQPIVEELKEDSGAESIDIKIYAEPESYDLPWMMELYVYLTANMKDLRRITDADALEILNNGVELGEKEYSYDGDVLEYALYTRTVTDDVTGTTHPVFVTLSDGDMAYSLEEDSLFDVNILYKQGAYETLKPPAVSQIFQIVILITIGLFAVLALLIYVNIGKYVKIKKEKTAEILAEKQADLSLGMDNILKQVDEDITTEKQADKKNLKKKILAISLIAVVVIALAIVFVVDNVVIPGNKYKEAVAMHESGNLDAAYTMFEELGNYKDCEERIFQIKCARVNQFIDEKKIEDAYLLLLQIADHEDAQRLISQLEQAHPYLSFLKSSKGDIITFGEYEQDNNPENGKEPIEWIVLHNEDGDMYLLSKYVLDAQPFNTANVKECSLDDWLKTTFSANAFSSVNSDIITRVGMLQEIDIDNYAMTQEQIIAEYTEYALAQKPERGYSAGLMWWMIKDELFNGSGHISAPVVWENGAHGKHSCDVTDRCGVRPAVWLFADSDNIPAEPVFDGSAPTQWRPGSSSSSSSGDKKQCVRCDGTGRVNKHYGNSWNKKPGYGYGDVCGGCGGTGYAD